MDSLHHYPQFQWSRHSWKSCKCGQWLRSLSVWKSANYLQIHKRNKIRPTWQSWVSAMSAPPCTEDTCAWDTGLRSSPVCCDHHLTWKWNYPCSFVALLISHLLCWIQKIFLDYLFIQTSRYLYTIPNPDWLNPFSIWVQKCKASPFNEINLFSVQC